MKNTLSLSTSHTAPAETQWVKVWDLPLRLFHWSLVLTMGSAIASGIAGGEWMTWHGRMGQAILGLLVFRWVWGVVGSRYARFSQFWPTPTQLRCYFQGKWQGVGHNPLGALSVLTLLSLLTIQAVLGLLSNDDIAFTGPLAQWVTEEQSLRLTGWHHQLATVLYGVIGLHLLAIVFHVVVKKHRLVRPMISGHTPLPQTMPHHPSLNGFFGENTPTAGRAWALIFAISVAVFSVYLSSGHF